ncbi:hypothetical protein Cyrtocomes_00902 [Candidatus Cyrtobacter comes]|uniref:Uncharacterized protein n=1 Tax=Candidatus Cyrtobacter comes TaxID=675776 RepID=A0ABU5L9C8_9RICK|nr:hypothetical protein [Candidatus Cyrtobacter comes]MDZ5762515.1 hypothetical protein [Candidatus Cyrtobacter comes]
MFSFFKIFSFFKKQGASAEQNSHQVVDSSTEQNSTQDLVPYRPSHQNFSYYTIKTLAKARTTESNGDSYNNFDTKGAITIDVREYLGHNDINDQAFVTKQLKDCFVNVAIPVITPNNGEYNDNIREVIEYVPVNIPLSQGTTIHVHHNGQLVKIRVEVDSENRLAHVKYIYASYPEAHYPNFRDTWLTIAQSQAYKAKGLVENTSLVLEVANRSNSLLQKFGGVTLDPDKQWPTIIKYYSLVEFGIKQLVTYKCKEHFCLELFKFYAPQIISDYVVNLFKPYLQKEGMAIVQVATAILWESFWSQNKGQLLSIILYKIAHLSLTLMPENWILPRDAFSLVNVAYSLKFATQKVNMNKSDNQLLKTVTTAFVALDGLSVPVVFKFLHWITSTTTDKEYNTIVEFMPKNIKSSMKALVNTEHAFMLKRDKESREFLLKSIKSVLNYLDAEQGNIDKFIHEFKQDRMYKGFRFGHLDSATTQRMVGNFNEASKNVFFTAKVLRKWLTDVERAYDGSNEYMGLRPIIERSLNMLKPKLEHGDEKTRQQLTNEAEYYNMLLVNIKTPYCDDKMMDKDYDSLAQSENNEYGNKIGSEHNPLDPIQGSCVECAS